MGVTHAASPGCHVLKVDMQGLVCAGKQVMAEKGIWTPCGPVPHCARTDAKPMGPGRGLWFYPRGNDNLQEKLPEVSMKQGASDSNICWLRPLPVEALPERTPCTETAHTACTRGRCRIDVRAACGGQQSSSICTRVPDPVLLCRGGTGSCRTTVSSGQCTQHRWLCGCTHRWPPPATCSASQHA